MVPSRAREFALNSSTLISNVGDGMHTLAIGQILFERTGQVTSFGIIIALNYLIGIVCQIYAGHLADHFARSRLVKYSDLARGVLVLGLAAAVYFSLPVHFIIIFSLLIKIGTQIYRPAYQAMISDAIRVDRLSAFNSKNVACMQGGQLLGMAFLGVLYILGPASVFVADALTFFISALIVHLLKIASLHSVNSKSSVVKSWKKAFHHGDKTWLSVFNATFSLGCIGSMVIMKYWVKEEFAQWWMLLQTFALSLLIFSGSSKLGAGAAYFGMGLGSTMASVHLLNRLMKRSPKNFQGRISALRYLFISLLIATIVPPLTFMFARGLNAGIAASVGVLFVFAGVAVVASRGESFLGKVANDEFIMDSDLKSGSSGPIA